MDNRYGSVKKERLYGLDLLKILSVIFVFLFHANTHCNISFGIMTPFISVGAIFMVAFFMLSGFALYYNYGENNDLSIKNLKVFYKKRLFSIYPLYIFLYILWLVFFNNISLFKNIVAAPMEILLLQGYFTGSFDILHNNGTWFVSCLAGCYLIFPFVANTIKQLTGKMKIVLIIVLYCICAYSQFAVYIFKFDSIYPDPFFRILQFIIGITLADLLSNCFKKKEIRMLFFVIEFSILVIIISLLTKFGFNYNNLDFLLVPTFLVMIISLANLKDSKYIKILSQKPIQIFSQVAYAFFLAQFFTWPIVNYLKIEISFLETNDFLSFIIAFIICSTISIGMHYLIEQPIKRILRKRSTN